MREEGQPRPGGLRALTTVVARARGTGADIVIVFIAVELACVLSALFLPKSFPYLSPANIRVMLQAAPDLGIVALGVGVLMIAGEFDLSVGANYTFASIVMASLVTGHGVSPFAAGVAALLIGIAIGLLNALATFGLRIPSFIATLGTSLFWEGFTLFYHGATFLSFNPGATFTALTTGSIGPIQAEFLWYVGLAVILWLIVHRHRLGNQFFAVGGNARAAVAVGVRAKRVKTIAFAVTGAVAALSGIISTTRVNSIVPGQGASLPLEAIAACVIGGLALNGGEGSMLGVFLGAMLIYTIQDVLLLMGAPGFYLNLFIGLLIVAAAGLNQLASRRTGN